MSAKFVLTFSSVGITILNVTGNHLWQIRMLLLYGKENIMTERLVVPHPYMTDRDFVMIPLAEINPQYKIKGKQAHEWSKKFNAMAIKKVSHTLGE